MDTRIDSRTGLEELDRDECLRLIAHATLGRLAVVVAGQPLVFPVNFTLDGDAVVFRTEPGTKLHGARNGPVAFECDGIDLRYHTGWSVLVLAIVEEVNDPTELARLDRLPLDPVVRRRRNGSGSGSGRERSADAAYRRTQGSTGKRSRRSSDVVERHGAGE